VLLTGATPVRRDHSSASLVPACRVRASRFLALLAARAGGILNKTDLGAPLGISVPTITEWLNALEVTGQILLLPPFYESFGKRLVKSPKVYFVDSGLACHLLGVSNAAALRKSAFAGTIFEGFVAGEIAEQQVNRGRRVELYYFRDQQGLEVDFVVPNGTGKLALIEAKASKTVTPAMAQCLRRLAAAPTRYRTRAFVVHDGSASGDAGRALAPVVSAVTLAELLAQLA
jgi:predicted AAA+ superfamily ATPase